MRRAFAVTLLSHVLACRGAEVAPDADVVRPTPAAPRWEDMGVHGANHQTSLQTVTDTATPTGLAHALIAGGNLARGEFDEHDECGTTVRSFRPVPADATLGDARLRRALLEPLSTRCSPATPC